MFLTNSNNKFVDTQFNSSTTTTTIPTTNNNFGFNSIINNTNNGISCSGVGLSGGNNNNSSSHNDGSSQFPTSILESLLQNSDVLEALMKPIANTTNDINLDTKFDDKLSFFDSLLEAKKIDEGEEDSSKIYGNGFLGSDLWNKDELFPSDKFGVKLEYLDVQEFLAENDLNAAEVEFLNQLQDIETKPKNDTITTGNNNNNNNNSSSSSSSSTFLNILQSPSKITMSSTVNTNNNSSSNNNDLLSIDLPNKFNFGNNNNNNNSKSTTNRSNSSDFPDFSDMVMSVQQSTDSNDSDSGNNKWDSKNIDFLDDSSMLSDEQLYTKMARYSSEDLLDSKKSKKFATGSTTSNNKNEQYIPNELKDEKYWNRRRKNNLAAKRSRDARRLKENQIALRAAFLERENQSLKRQLDEFKRETKVLKTRLARYEPKV